MFIVAKKDIPAGAEIFVDYGREYWQNVRHNLKLDEQEKNAKAMDHLSVRFSLPL